MAAKPSLRRWKRAPARGVAADTESTNAAAASRGGPNRENTSESLPREHAQKSSQISIYSGSPAPMDTEKSRDVEREDRADV
jgi:hypothetical protein